MKMDKGPPVVTCSRCKAAYNVDVEQMGTGRNICCSVCAHQWFQLTSKLHPLPATKELIDYPVEMKERVAAGKSAKPEIRYTAYVNNLPYEATEQVQPAA